MLMNEDKHTCCSVLSCATDTQSWPMCLSLTHWEHTLSWSVRQYSLTTLSCCGHSLALSSSVAGISLWVFPWWRSSWTFRWDAQYESKHTRQDFTALLCLPLQMLHFTSVGLVKCWTAPWDPVCWNFSTTSPSTVFLLSRGFGLNTCRHWGQLYWLFCLTLFQ